MLQILMFVADRQIIDKKRRSRCRSPVEKSRMKPSLYRRSLPGQCRRRNQAPRTPGNR